MDKVLDCYSLQEVARLNAHIRVLEKTLSVERDAAAQVMRNEESAIAERDELRSRLKAAEEVIEAVEAWSNFPINLEAMLLAALAKYEERNSK